MEGGRSILDCRAYHEHSGIDDDAGGFLSDFSGRCVWLVGETCFIAFRALREEISWI